MKRALIFLMSTMFLVAACGETLTGQPNIDAAIQVTQDSVLTPTNLRCLSSEATDAAIAHEPLNMSTAESLAKACGLPTANQIIMQAVVAALGASATTVKAVK